MRRPDGDDGVALLMSLALMGVFATLMLTMLALVVQQVKPNAQARKDIGSLNAASSGLQAGLAVLRGAVDEDGQGSRRDLPCATGSGGDEVTTFQTGSAVSHSWGAALAGSTSTAAGQFTYRTSVAYFDTDPTGQSPAWLHAQALRCPLMTTPLFAYLQSYGTGANLAGAGGNTGNRGNRSQTGVYQFQVPAANIAGGRLREYGVDLCVDAGEAPAVGSALTLQACLPLGAARQTWQYRQDLTLFYGGNPALNLCIQGTQTQPPALARCTGTGDGATYTSGGQHYARGQQIQLWSFNDDGHFAAAADNGDVSGSCLQPEAAGGGVRLTVYGCTGGTTEFRSFDPDPQVGAGKAGGNLSGRPGSPTSQYVNFEEFGRCLDVTSQQVTASFLIAYPCKQAPDSTRLTWNQVWTFTATSGAQGTMSTNHGGRYCLTAPDTDEYVTLRPCATDTRSQLWTATGEQAGSPTTSYELVSTTRSQCLSLGGTRTSYGSLKIVLANCDGTLRQRWNAPPPLPPTGLSNIQEGSTPR